MLPFDNQNATDRRWANTNGLLTAQIIVHSLRNAMISGLEDNL